MTCHDLATDEFIQRIMTAYSFANVEQRSTRAEETSGMQSTGCTKDGLGGPQRVGQRADHVGRNERARSQRRTSLHRQSVEGGFAADAAAGSRIEVALDAAQVKGKTGAQRYRHDI